MMQTSLFYRLYILSAVLFFAACGQREEKRFTLLSPDETGVHFENSLEDTPEFSILNYLYFYDGGGVAAGDINNDGLPDLFFTGNEVQNRLYLNKGDFQFDDITEQAGITDDPGAWSTGVTMADVNGDGYLDIYVSRVNFLNKSGPNQLFINNGNETFTESASGYGLDFSGYSTHALFFDYNRDGLLDLFLLNHSFHSERTYGEAEELRAIRDPRAGDRLYRNDGNMFTDVTEEAGIYSSALGYGLGVAVSDINKDGWPDIYVGNDFHEDDYLYINNGDGTFAESLYSMIGHTSSASMGNDIADINNDGWPDIISLDMMPADYERFMRSGGPDLYPVLQAKQGYGFGSKNERNTLQLHRGLSPEGTPVFSEIGFLAGVAATDWSWASLFADLDNDGFKDLYVTNGMPRRPNDLDYIRARNHNREQQDSNERGGFEGEILTEEEMELLQYMPELKISNYAFQNNGDLTFADKTDDWGLADPSFSNGAAWADLNDDGSLDLVVNNINRAPFIYKNNTEAGLEQGSGFLKITLEGSGKNTSGLGAKVTLFSRNGIFYQEQMPVRGFQSSIDHELHFGLGGVDVIDSVRVDWPDGSRQTLEGAEANSRIRVYQDDAEQNIRKNPETQHAGAIFFDITDDMGISYRHRENSFNDFSREPLLPFKMSTQGPAFTVGDVTGNGLDDIYLGGARWQRGSLFLQEEDGLFTSSNEELFEEDRGSEDVDAVFFDADGDGLLDLYVVSGGGELTGLEDHLKDRLYLNRGNGRFEKTEGSLPEIYMNGSVVRAADFNGDGFQDLFVGTRAEPYSYGRSPRNFLLQNDGTGTFRDVTGEYAPGLSEIGMVTDARWDFFSNAEFPDLIVAGEWMPLEFFRNNGGGLEQTTDEAGLENDKGLWQSVETADLNGDGLTDIIAGNFGQASRLQASENSPVKLFVSEFGNTGQTSPVMAIERNGAFYPFEQVDELLAQMPFLTRRISSYRDFSSKNLDELFGEPEMETSLEKEITELASVIYINNGDGTFRKQRLPAEAQMSPVFSIYLPPADSAGRREVLLAGNFYAVKPGIGGQQDAGYGVHLTVDKSGAVKAKNLQESGFFVQGETRGIGTVKQKDGVAFIVVRNNDTPLFYRREKR